MPLPPSTPALRLDWALLVVLGLALAFRLWHLDTPFIDAHSWRQVTNADISRHFAEGSLNPFSPRVSWGGRDGVVGMEFPLLQWVTGALWRVTGETYLVGRLVAVVFALLGVAAMYALGARLFGRATGLASAVLLAISPSLVFFGRTFISDTPMLAFMIAAVWAWDVYAERPSWAWLTLATACTALAALVKLPAILVLGPIAGVAWAHRGWAALRDRRAVGAIAVAVVLAAGWYWYADQIYVRTGLTQAVFRPSGTYPPAVAPGVQFTSVSHWTTRARLMSGESWIEFLDRFWGLHLTPVGAALAGLGWWLARGRRGRWAVDLWALAGASLFLVAMEGQFWHEFHQLPLLPPLFLYGGVAAAPLFDREWLQRRLPGWRGPAAVSVLIVAVAVQGFRLSGVERHLFRPDNLQYWLINTGAVVREVTSPDDLVATVEYSEGGANSPMILYFAHRQGWSFDTRSITVDEVEWLRTRLGARYLVTTAWTTLVHDKPDVADRLSAAFTQIPLTGLPDEIRLFDLRRPR